MRNIFWLLPVAAALVVTLALPATGNAQANFKVSDLVITPESVKQGETVTISATVKNEGNKQGEYTVTLKIDDQIVDTKEVNLAAGESETVEFTVTASTSGHHIVDLNGLPGYFTVKTSFWAIFPTWIWAAVGSVIGVLILLLIVLLAMPSRRKQPEDVTKAKSVDRVQTQATQAQIPTLTPIPGMGPTMPFIGQQTQPTQPQTPASLPPLGVFPATGPAPAPGPFPAPGPKIMPHPPYTGRAFFSVSNLVITPNQVKAGEPITISAIISNNGSEAGKYSVVLRVNGLVESITELALPGGGTQTTTFTLIKDVGGDYYIEVDGLGGMVTVVPLIPANFSVCNLLIAPERVKQGENVTISAVVTNNGEMRGSHTLALKLKGATESIKEVNLGPGESQQVVFNVNKNTPGFYNVELEGLTGRFVVEMEWQG